MLIKRFFLKTIFILLMVFFCYGELMALNVDDKSADKDFVQHPPPADIGRIKFQKKLKIPYRTLNIRAIQEKLLKEKTVEELKKADN